MKRAILSMSVVALFALSACNNAANKIKDKEKEEQTTNQEQPETNANNAAAQQNAPANDGPKPAFNFEKEMHDFGSIEEGTVAKHNFTFTNTGEAPLIITSANGSCGCTVPSWPREPIAPGETGTIHVEFNSNGRPGNQQKNVTINANTVPNKKILRIRAQVEPKATEEAAEPAS